MEGPLALIWEKLGTNSAHFKLQELIVLNE